VSRPTLPTDREGSLFQRISSGPAGIDPYASAVSDVYQDLFGEGSYIGKGIYDIDAFEAALAGRVPENALLSHDLFEGVFARAGLVTDIELFEEFPSNYEVAVVRQHRWARGDWQLLPWIIGDAPDASNAPIRTSIPLIGRWKMLDNLRRTLFAPAAFLTLIAGWTLPFAAPSIWTTFVLACIAIPALLQVLIGAIPRRRGISKRSHARAVGTDLMLAASHVGLTVTLLAHQAWLMTDAIVRTLTRVYVTRRKLLEWVTAAQAKSGFDLSLRSSYRRMSAAVALAFAAVILVAFQSREVWPIAAPFALVWALSPMIAYSISLPPPASATQPLSQDEVHTLRLTARRTWRFFETFVGPDDHALPPDNFQEEPTPVVAHRTSPTNLGLYLLSIVAAHDFGWISTVAAIERLEATLGTMKGLERFRGHFYNWYDTRDLRPLDPKYISSVDSGNLAGHLIALGQACHEMINRALLGPDALSGIADTILLLRQSALAIVDDRRTQTVTRKHLDEALDALTAALSPVPVSVGDWVLRLTELGARADTMTDIARTLTAERGDSTGGELVAWAEAVRTAIESHARDFDAVIPWARFVFGKAPIDRAMLPEQELVSAMMARFCSSMPTLADTPNRCESAISELTTLRERLSQNGSAQSDGLAGIDALIESLAHSAAACEALARRISTLVQLTKAIFEEMNSAFSSIQLVNCSRSVTAFPTRASTQVAMICWRPKRGSPVLLLLLRGTFRQPIGFISARFDARRSGIGAGLLVGFDVRILDARARHALAVGQSLRPDLFSRCSSPEKIWNERSVPWGVSESAYNARDLDLTYQYSNFGVPGLGLKRGLSEDVVIAPYATALAAMIDPKTAAANFVRLAEAGGSGRYGFYEALDYTAARVPENQTVAVVRAYMGTSPGNVAGRACKRAPRRRDARALSR
jgi:cyclic beta-1,2-glucan synthetase